MEHPMGESKLGRLRVDFDRCFKLEFHGSKITSDTGLLACRELIPTCGDINDALGLTEVAVPGSLFRKILGLIDDLRRRPAPA